MKIYKNIDAYIAAQPEHLRSMLAEIRAIILKAAPEAEESISYGMPAFKLHGKYLVYFAVWKNHIGLYPLPSGIKTF